MEKKKKNHGCLIAIVVVVILGIIGAGMSPKETASTGSATSAAATAAPTAAPTEAPTPEPTPITYEATAESMQMLFENIYSKEYQDLTVTLAPDDSGANVCTVAYNPTGAYWDDNAFVEDCISTYINFGRQAYAIDGVDYVYFSVSQSMKDSRGNTSVYPVVEIGMPKDKFTLYNWDEVTGSIISQFYADCDAFVIDPNILANVEVDNVYYIRNT